MNSKAAQKQPHARNFSSVQTGKSQKQENSPTSKQIQKGKSREIRSLGQVRVQQTKTGQEENRNRTQRRENSTEMAQTEICGG